MLNPFSAKLTKWPKTLKKFAGNLPTNCLSEFGHFVGLALKGLTLITTLIKQLRDCLKISLKIKANLSELTSYKTLEKAFKGNRF